MAAVTQANSVSFLDGVAYSNDVTDGFVFAGPEDILRDSTNLLTTRTANGDWALTRTAVGAETYNFRIPINNILMSRLGVTYSKAAGGPRTVSKGIKITSVSLIYKIGVAALTTHTVTGINQTTYANNVATAVTAFSANSGTLATATQANPYVTSITVTTPAFFNTDVSLLNFEWQAVMANTGTLAVSGAIIYFNYNL